MNLISQNPKIRNLLFCIALIGLGLISRKFHLYLPEFVLLYLGDGIWAMMIYFFFRIFLHKIKITIYGIFSLLYCYLTEISQLYHSAWLDSIRNTTIGGLILGFGFLWSDIIAYSAGTITACLIDYLIQNKK